MAETKKGALNAYGYFLDLYSPKYAKGCLCFKKNKDSLFTFIVYIL